jgi:alpha-tubulin suppressor-like RCC1 family protein
VNQLLVIISFRSNQLPKTNIRMDEGIGETVVYGWGNPLCLEQADGTTEDCSMPRLQRIPSADRVTAIACGQFHTLAVVGGQVFVWGQGLCGRLSFPNGVECLNPQSGIHGQLGLGDVKQITHPTLIPGLAAIESVAAGSQHSVALSGTLKFLRRFCKLVSNSRCVNVVDGRVFAWGAGAAGQLGLGSTDDFNSPQLVPPTNCIRGLFLTCFDQVPLSAPCTTIACGQLFTLAATSDYRTYSWGSSKFAQCGHGRGGNKFSPREIAALHNERVVCLAAGWTHAAAITGASLFGRIFVVELWSYGVFLCREWVCVHVGSWRALPAWTWQRSEL